MEIFLDKVWEVLTRYLDILIVQFEFDVWYLSQWWAWAPLGIPGIMWSVIMIFKWVLLTLPISALIGGIFRNQVSYVISPIVNYLNKRSK